MKNYSKYGKGWFKESERHRLARLGVKTGRKSASRGFGLGTRLATGVSYSKRQLYTAKFRKLVKGVLSEKLNLPL